MNFPTIPDNYNKLLIVIGLLLVIFGFINESNLKQHIAWKKSDLNNDISNLNIEILRSNKEIQFQKDAAKYISLKYGINNPVDLNDSNLVYIYRFGDISPKESNIRD